MAKPPYQWTDLEGTDECVRCGQPGPEEEFSRAGYCPLCAKDEPNLNRDQRGRWQKKEVTDLVLDRVIISDPGSEVSHITSPLK